MPEAPRILALGLGNILCGDDGFGIHAIERLYAGYDLPANLRAPSHRGTPSASRTARLPGSMPMSAASKTKRQSASVTGP